MSISNAINQHRNPERALVSQRFFKTGEGDYGEGDVFIGLSVPQCRTIAKKYSTLSLSEVKELLYSEIHEERLIALLILVEQYKKTGQKEIIDFYLDHLKQVNNWDLVDTSADKLVGTYLIDREKTILYRLAQSENLWERRVAIIATFAFIRQKQFEDTLRISEILMRDTHDLIHKAVGWMLREVGKRDHKVLERFLEKHSRNMPRTMLRYAIEKFDAIKRKEYLRR